MSIVVVRRGVFGRGSLFSFAPGRSLCPEGNEIDDAPLSRALREFDRLCFRSLFCSESVRRIVPERDPVLCRPELCDRGLASIVSCISPSSFIFAVLQTFFFTFFELLFFVAFFPPKNIFCVVFFFFLVAVTPVRVPFSILFFWYLWIFLLPDFVVGCCTSAVWIVIAGLLVPIPVIPFKVRQGFD